MDSDGPIGVLASGLGGLAAAVELARRMPHEDLLVLSDEGWSPWARRPGRVVAQRCTALAADLVAGGAKLIVLASLQGTLDAITALQAAAPVPVIGFEPAALIARAAATGLPCTVVVAPGSVRRPQLEAVLKRTRSGGVPVVDTTGPLPTRGVVALASAAACASPPALPEGVVALSAAAIAAERAHRTLVRGQALARRRRPGRRMLQSSFPASTV